MTQAHLDERVKIMPLHETLRQGQKNVLDQFVYRYNTDQRTVVAAVAQFHRGLWFTLFASCDPKIIELLSNQTFLGIPASVLVKPGELLETLAVIPGRRRLSSYVLLAGEGGSRNLLHVRYSCGGVRRIIRGLRWLRDKVTSFLPVSHSWTIPGSHDKSSA